MTPSAAPPAQGRYIASVIVPAHNEERTVGRLLGRIGAEADRHDLEIVVVCNGCTDRTAEVAGRYPAVRVLETPVASKADALRLGDDDATAFPRVYMDADVEIDADAIRRLVSALSEASGLLAVGPERHLARQGAPLLVRWYYDVWERLPQVKDGLFGRGVIALTAAGNQRVRGLPAVMSDDLAFSEAFSPSERAVVGGVHVIVRPPRAFGDLVRRRVRVATGMAQIDAHHLRGREARTGMDTLVRIAAREPWLAIRLPIFVVVTVLARLGARQAVRRGDFSTWLRDESSRDS